MESKPQSEPALSVGQVFARRVRQVRLRRNWTQQRLAEEMAKVGHPMPRGAVAKLESGVQRPENISLEMTVALCAALNVPLVSMLASLELDELVQVTPAITTTSEAVRKWIRGAWMLEATDRNPDNLRAYFTEHPLEELTTASGGERDRWSTSPRPGSARAMENEKEQS